MLSRAQILMVLVIQNIFLHRMKSLVVGGILFFGSLFLCTALNLTRSVELSMAESIQGSLGGDFQVYDARARDTLSLFGGAFFGREELGFIPDWRAVAGVIGQHPAVAAVVPMGFEGGFIKRGNDFDELFDKLRDYVRLLQATPDSTGTQVSTSNWTAMGEHIALVQQNLVALQRDLAREQELLVSDATSEDKKALVEAALAPQFWQQFSESVRQKQNDATEQALAFLESRIAPLAGDKAPVYLRYMGTDLDLFRTSFSRFTLKSGTLPTGNEGWILLPERFFETELKNLAAVSFDKITEAMRDQGLTPSTDAALASTLRQLPNQALPLIVAIAPSARQQLARELAAFLAQPEGTPFEDLVRQFLRVDASNALQRAEWFARNMAPVARLHEIEVGELLYLRAYTRTGFLRTLPLRLAGIYNFRGLARSDLAGQTSIIDLASYRELYGVMSEGARAELEDLTKSITVSGARTALDSQSLEASLFGEEGAEPQDTSADGGNAPSTPSPQTGASLAEKPVAAAGELAISLAIILKDRSEAKAVFPELREWITSRTDHLQIVDWKQASGLVGQLVTALRAVLLISVFVILVVGATIINNSLMMSTLERTREIGTLRAIGATRMTVTTLFLGEIVVLAAASVYGGALAALGLNVWLNKTGIPAMSDFVVFLFSGPRLYPYVDVTEPLAAATVLLVLAVVSSAFPARLASRIEPAVAMQEKE